MADWFRVVRRPARQAGPRWRVAATIERTDTDEVVERLWFRDAAREDVEARMDRALADTLARLVRPADWGRDPTVPHLLRRWLELRNEVYGMFLRRDPDTDAFDRRERAKLAAAVEALTEVQRLELADPTTEQVAAVDDPWVLDLLSAKKDLALLLTAPSPAVQAAMQRLQSRLDR